ncbi:hypothetical protein [Brevibacterium aurantiacum]|uniref:Uncharacterized protein n=1 Tax=Brevibacterium aurantiacum TaxID=273384 RepID=A0A2A3YX32_BREAU|nr:hypothetical protein [Brevibacterium aurantiacum]PCC43811.1 hypothetical protein CIK65_04215 [Brevibacterium aurantiacum]SMY01942.1 hypothetical protein BAURA86_03119 [Brevibacterium aurantiacum]
MSLNDPALGFFHQKSKVRVVSIALWCLVVFFAFLTGRAAVDAGSGTGGSAADRVPALPILQASTFVLGFGTMLIDFATAKVRGDLAGWAFLRLVGTLCLGLAAGWSASLIALREFPIWWLLMMVLSIAILCIPAGISRLLRHREREQLRVRSTFRPVPATVTNVQLVKEMDMLKHKVTVSFIDDAGRRRWHIVRTQHSGTPVKVGDACRVQFDPARLRRHSSIVVSFA